MITLPESEYIHIKQELINAPSFVYAVLDHSISGAVYMDSMDKNYILIGTSSGIFYIMGDDNNKSINEFLLELYQNKVNEQARFTLFSASSKWDDTIKQIFENNDLHISRYKRYALLFNQEKYDEQKVLLPKEYSVERTNEIDINQSLEFGSMYYEEYWGSVSNFLKNGFGYCIRHNGQIVSECISIFRSKQFAEIDIATNDAYRGKGLAYRNAQAFIDFCIAHQLTPGWDCDVTNKASILLGKKLGFEIAREYSVFTKRK